ncbi:MgtC/SapB transporter [Oleidesulfovibrio alaskensis G20]|jgi:putative Mg2+ transporter-C (MgtC) family protein|uniref:MgtC/SapB transporter n=1 Tax=Oleidesulfovibrio alaskensis (strain ATCC BAA-1058 / DSM 17464 / G20) TaxID=207559 RepID=Q313F5_OLEA2|nr:MgtC/SapB family protein [Oleidesulfovibrio alaskensis]ABB37941.1 MgtC/SapB transporter [Oleidesulfovibrio alaskensis G20]MBG0772909.1 MgtC/SapB family protein [Oleidesulfovibrio alaskensis]MBL3582535.1 MgtC/SapB family protein [Oleidesulfovibrio alaskensis]
MVTASTFMGLTFSVYDLMRMGQFVIAALLGGVIGYERETRGQAAGFRTNMIVAVGACLMMQMSLLIPEMFRTWGVESVVRVDPGRIASYAIASIGFVGGGAILKGRGSVHGLTTAASLWIVTGIGLAVGAGLILPAILATFVVVTILFFLPTFVGRFVRRSTRMTLTLCLYGTDITVMELMPVLQRYEAFAIQPVGYEHNVDSGMTTFVFRVRGSEHAGWSAMASSLRQLDGLASLHMEEAPVP